MNAFPMIERCAVPQWRALTDLQREEMEIGLRTGYIVSNTVHRPLAHLWWVEVGARQDADYRLLPLMSVKEG